MIDNNNILKILLEADADPNDPQKQPNEKPTKPHGFEEDPMGFIIRKYHGLTRTLVDLMSSDFKQYLTAIFVVAPKPTTFKIVLHNGQFFFITYMGKGFYEANISGKRYYMNNIGTKERAMQAIARLLKFGSPLKTKGPEGAEQGTREDDGTGNSPNSGFANGGGGGYAQTGGGEEGGEEAEETGGEETGGEESLKEISLVKSLLKFKNVGQNFINALIKEVYLPSKSKIKVAKKQSLQEAKVQDLRLTFNDAMKAAGLNGDKGAKRPPHLRYQLGPNAIKDISKVADKVIGKGNYSVKEAQKGSMDSASGTYPTIKVTVIKSTQAFKKGEFVLIVNQTGSENKSVTFKALTPVKLGIAGEYKDLNSLVRASTNAVSKDKNLGPVLKGLIADTANNTPTAKSGLSKLKSGKTNVALSKNTTALLNKISKEDKNTIGKDFGEVLGGIFLGKMVGIKQDLVFPKGNEPLVDFYIDGYKISSKYEKGASASLTDLLKAINPNQIKGDKNQAALYKALLPMISETSPNAFLKIASAFPKDMPAIQTLGRIVGIDPKNLTSQNINDYIKKLFAKTNAKTAKQKNEVFFKKFGKLFSEMKRNPGKADGVEWDTMNKKTGDNGYYGAITSPLSYYVADQMNTKPKFVQALKEIISKTEVKQMYLTFDLKEGGSMGFDIRSFNDPNAQFKFDIPSLSTLNPTSSKLGFTLVK